jgi:hypothetical protein
MRLRAFGVAICAFVIFAFLQIIDSPRSLRVAMGEQSKAGSSKQPEPTEKSNCVVCHLKAGRELTDAVHTFALSVHDAQGLSCNDCHGGNTEVDAKAHEEEFGFIGTKISAHLETCTSCHEDPAADFAKGPHYWNQSEKINIDFPLCIDCHGNHDVGNPPPDFSMSLVCTDCHDDFATKFAAEKSITETNDRLWESIRKWREANPGIKRVPDALEEELASIRTKTAAIIHPARKVTDAEAQSLNKQVEEFRKKLDADTAKTAK